jgi:hypothetical protein
MPQYEALAAHNCSAVRRKRQTNETGTRSLIFDSGEALSIASIKKTARKLRDQSQRKALGIQRQEPV